MKRGWVSFILYVYMLHLMSQNYTNAQVQRTWDPGAIKYFSKDAAESKHIHYLKRIAFVLYRDRETKHDFKYYSLAVLFDNGGFVTSFNPFREMIHHHRKPGESKSVICYTDYAHHLNWAAHWYTYRFEFNCRFISCGREIIPQNEADMPDYLWHGPDKRHSPKDDIMVLRRFENVDDTWYRQRIYFATNTTPMFRNIDIVGIGLNLPENHSRLIEFEVYNYPYFEDIAVDCTEWLPNNLGRFICVRNDFQYGFGSGSFLFSESVLFGIGSFSMYRDKDGILVFTDVRPYEQALFYKTCSPYDGY